MIDRTRVLEKLDEHLHKNDYDAAERHLRYWLAEAQSDRDVKTALLIQNELMGLLRKCGRGDEAVATAEAALQTVEANGLAEQVGAATTYLNSATVFKAFNMAERGIALFEKAREIYERELSPDDARLGGLYNNMALALVDLRLFDEALILYQKAIDVMNRVENGAPETAITYLNMASAAEAEHGLLDAAETIESLLDTAERLLEEHKLRDGNYAFVCEKCATVFGYYGRFAYEKELKARAKSIYEGT